MKTSSCKSKGRKAQQEVCKALLEKVYPHLEAGDITSTSMGVSGVDIRLSPAAQKSLDLAIEVKNVEKLNVVTTFNDHYEKYAKKPSLKILAHRRNRQPMLATLLFDDLLTLLAMAVEKPQ